MDRVRHERHYTPISAWFCPAPLCYDSGVFRLSKSAVSPSLDIQSAAGGAGRCGPLTDRAMAALVTLLARESKRDNVAIIRSRLEEIGSDALPWLDAAAAVENGGCGAAAELATHIRRQTLDSEWMRWAEAWTPDLERGALLIDRFGDPCRDPRPVSRSLDRLADDLGRRLVGASSGEETLARLRAFLFSERGFLGNAVSYEDPQNSYLSCVLAQRRGIPVSLSVVVLLLGQRLDLPILGIGMPGHFLVRYGTDPAGPYVDAFGGGRVLTREDCAAWLHASGFAFDPRMLRPVGPRYIVARMLRNLVALFSNQGASPEAGVLSGYLSRVLAAPEARPHPEPRPRGDFVPE